MLIIPIKEGENIDRALKRYKRKFDRTKTMKNLRSRKNFTKPSIANRAQRIKASYVQKLRAYMLNQTTLCLQVKMMKVTEKDHLILDYLTDSKELNS
jgi:small subunit ribosomal protein S21